MISKALIHSTTALATGLCATVAIAQAAPADRRAAAVAPVGDQDIIVTARKRNERLQDVPAAITAVSARDIARYQTNTITQITTRVPDLVVATASGPGGSAISLRGIGTSGTNPTVDQAVSLNIDGVQLSQSNGVNLATYDLDRVEVLKGPQALFYGKNSLGGIISLVSADPGKDFEWRLRGGYEFENKNKQVDGMVSIPVTDTIGIRLVGAYDNELGWFRNSVNAVPGGQPVTEKTAPKQRDYFARGTIKFQSPDGRLDVKLKASYAEKRSDNGLAATFQIYSCPLGVPQTTFGAPGGVNDCSLDRHVVDPRISAAAAALEPGFFRDGVPFFNQKQFLSSLTANYKLADNLTLTSVTGYYDLHEAWSANYSGVEDQAVVTASKVSQKQTTEEVRLSSSFSSPFNFVVGGFYQNAKMGFAAPLLLDGAATGFTGPLLVADDHFRQKTQAYSFFVQGTYKITPKLELSAGGRYSHEHKTIAGYRLASALDLFNPDPVPFTFDPSGASFHNFSPEVTLRYSPTRNISLYGAYRQGFQSGGFNAVPGNFSSFAPNNVKYDQAKAKGGEIGTKGTFADHQISFDIALYNYKYTNLQVPVLDPTTIALTVVNAATARSRGVETSFSVSPRDIKGLTLRSTVAYNQGKYLSYPGAACYSGQSAAQGCNLNLVPLTNPQTGAVIGSHYSAQNLAGKPLERAPAWTMDFGFTYDRPITDQLTLSIASDANYTGSYYAMPEHDPRSIQHETWLFNAQVGVRGPRDGWELALIGKNLTNELRAPVTFGFPLTGGAAGLASPGLGADLAGGFTEPRTLLLQLTLRNTLFQ